VASNENGYLGGMMVSYPFRDIEPSTVNDCFGSEPDVAPHDFGMYITNGAPEEDETGHRYIIAGPL
jgi:hypothetical protein